MAEKDHCLIETSLKKMFRAVSRAILSYLAKKLISRAKEQQLFQKTTISANLKNQKSHTVGSFKKCKQRIKVQSFVCS